MSWAFSGKLIKKAGKEQQLVPWVFAAHPGTTDEEMLELALWLKENGYRVEQVQTCLPSPLANDMPMSHSGKSPLHKAMPESVGVYIPRGLRQRRLYKQRRLQKAFLCYHDSNNWPMLRAALRRMGRADLIGSGKHQLIPAYQPAGTGQVHDGHRGGKRFATQHTGLPHFKPVTPRLRSKGHHPKNAPINRPIGEKPRGKR